METLIQSIITFPTNSISNTILRNIIINTGTSISYQSEYSKEYSYTGNIFSTKFKIYT